MIDVIKCSFLVLMGLFIMILGIYGLLSEGKKFRKTSKLYQQYEQTSEFSKEMINKFYKADHQSKAYTFLLLLGCGILLIGGFFLAEKMMAYGVVKDIRNTLVWICIQGGIAVLFGLIMIWSGVTIGRKRVAENDMVDGIIHGKVVKIDTSSQMFPSYGKLIIEYQDPYDGSINRYSLLNELRVKKHPLGSSYLLHYARNSRKVYDIESNKQARKLWIFLTVFGIVICIIAVTGTCGRVVGCL